MRESRRVDRTFASMLIVSVLSVVSAIGVAGYLVAENEEYRDAVSSLSERVVATVVEVDPDTRYLAAEWSDEQGRRWVESLVQRERGRDGSVEVGDPVILYYNPQAPEHGAYVDPRDASPVSTRLAGAIVLVVLCLPVPVAWAVRWLRLWWAARAPVLDATVAAHSSVYTGVSPRGAVHQDGPLWLEIVSGGGSWLQRIMWNDRLVELAAAGPLEGAIVRGRPRASRPAFVVDVPGAGRLWPAGRARRDTGPWQLAPLSQRRPLSTHAAPRATRLVVAVVAAAVVGILLWSLSRISGVPAVLYAVVQLVALIFFLGGNTLGFLRRAR